MDALERAVGDAVVKVVLGDITDQDCDVLVNAANSSLLGGGGVDGAIHRRGGPRILEECKVIRATSCPNGLPTGEVAVTSGGNMKALHVIHTVGPIWKGGGSRESELLSMAYRNSLDKAESLGARSIAFPAISTGAYGYPVDKACWVAMEAVLDFLLKGNRTLKEIRFVLFSESDYRVYEDALERLKMPVM